MKPWPSLLAERYPLPPGAFPERPWWRTVGVNRGMICAARVRCDGVEISAQLWEDPTPVEPWMPRFGLTVYHQGGQVHISAAIVSQGNAAEYAEIDRLLPRPRPDHRVGQTWAVVLPHLFRDNTGMTLCSACDRNKNDWDGEEDCYARVFTTTEHDPERMEGKVESYCPPGSIFGFPGWPGVLKPWHLGGTWMTEEEVDRLLKDAYLLADQVCPSHAPWSSS